MKSKDIYLRAIEPTDLESLYLWENDPQVWRVSGTTSPFSKYVLKQYIENSHLDIYQTKQLRLIIVSSHDDRAIGAIDLFDFDPTNRRIGVGILIYSSEERGKSYASQALGLVIEYCFKTLGLHQIYCNITSDNTPSHALFSKYGFKTIGTKIQWLYVDGKWVDEDMLQLIDF